MIYLFKASYPSASKFKYVVQALAKVTDESPFYAKIDGLESRVLSPDKTTMIIVKIPSIAFEEYEVSEETGFIVPVADLNKIVRRATRNDSLILEYKPGDEVLKIVFRNKKTSVERVFYVNARGIGEEAIQEIKIELSVTARFVADDYKQLIRDLKTIGEEAVFHYKNGKLLVYSHAQHKEYVGEFSEGNPLAYLSSTVDEVKSIYSVSLLEATLKPLQSAKYVTLYFDTDKPAKVEFEIGEGGYIVYWIVPRLEA
ncbi:MAG: DNA polymerase sliding clamp [Desulfurococcaceae archaeon]